MSTKIRNGLKKSICSLLILVFVLALIPAGALAESGDIYLAFSSDAHNSNNDKSVQRIGYWLKSVSAANGNTEFDAMGFCGDMGSANNGFNASAYWDACGRMLKAVEDSHLVKDIVYTTGNHEYSPGDYSDRKTGGVYDRITRIGLAKRTGDYEIYCFGAHQYDYYFVDEDIAKLEEYLDGAPDDIPIFVLSHFPLHKYASRTIGKAANVINILNSHSNVIFIWGHNHTESDTHYDHVYSGELDGTPINFIYASAGCMSDDEYSSGSNSVAGKGLCVKIDGDNTVMMTYYGDAGTDFSATSTFEANITDGTVRRIRETPLEENFTTEHDYARVSNIEAGGKYVITSGDLALTNKAHSGYHNQNGYDYFGFYGEEVEAWESKLIAGVKDYMVWTAEAVSGGIALKNANGKYLTARYQNDVVGCLELTDTPHAWTFDGTKFKSVSTGKYMNYEVESDLDQKQSGSADLFDIRTNGKDVFNIYKEVEPGWKPAEQETVGVYASSLVDGESYVITAQGFGMTNVYHAGYTCVNGNTYSYHGFTGKPVTIVGNNLVSEVDASMVWTAKKVNNGFALLNSNGQYLTARYTSGAGGSIDLGSSQNAWVYDGSTLKHYSTGKQLNYEVDSDVDGTLKSGSTNLFDIRTDADDNVRLYKVSADDVVDTSKGRVLVDAATYCTKDSTLALENGKKFVIASGNTALSADENAGYATLDTANKYYKYDGLTGVDISGWPANMSKTFIESIDNKLLWEAESADGGFKLKNVATGTYLKATYESNLDIEVKGESHLFSGFGHLYLDAEGDVWSVESNKQLKSKACGKILNWCTSHSGNLIDGADNFFTVRTGGSDLYTIDIADTSLKLADGQKYVIVVRNGSTSNYYALNTKAANYKNSQSGYLYYGFAGVRGTVSSDIFTPNNGISDDMFWTVTNTANGLTIQDKDGKYLYSYYNNGGYIRLDDTFPHYWTLTAEHYLKSKDTGEKFLVWDTNGNIIGPRSSGKEIKFYVLDQLSYVQYKSAGHGTVSSKVEFINGELKGSTATAANGYHFVNWTNEAGEEVSTDAKFVPSGIKQNTAFTANFAENGDVTIHYTAGKGGSVSAESESLAPATGKAKGSTATPDEGYHFLHWVDASGKEVSTRETYVPRMTNGAFVDGTTYTAVFEHDPVCMGYKQTALEEGTFNVTFGATEYGSITFQYVSNSWTLFDNQAKKYIAASGSTFAYDDEAYYWNYDGGFYSQSSTLLSRLLPTLFKAPKYYLTVSNGELKLTTAATDVTIMKYFVIQDHDCVYTSNGDGTHTAVCKNCGKSIVEDHEYIDHVCVCGATDVQSETTMNVKVTVTEKTEKVRFLLFFTRTVTTYTAAIDVETDGAEVVSVQYNTGSGWKTGKTFSSSTAIGAFDIQVKDANGELTSWRYNGTTTVKL